MVNIWKALTKSIKREVNYHVDIVEFDNYINNVEKSKC